MAKTTFANDSRVILSKAGKASKTACDISLVNKSFLASSSASKIYASYFLQTLDATLFPEAIPPVIPITIIIVSFLKYVG